MSLSIDGWVPGIMRCAKGIFAKGFWGCRRFSLLQWEKGSETPSCDGETGLRLPRSSCSDLGNEGVSDPFSHRKRESQTLFPTTPRTSPKPLSENPLSATHQGSDSLLRNLVCLIENSAALQTAHGEQSLALTMFSLGRVSARDLGQDGNS